MLKHLWVLCLLGCITSLASDEIRVFLKLNKDQNHQKIIDLILGGKQLSLNVRPIGNNGKSQLVVSQIAGEYRAQSRNCFYEGEVDGYPNSFVHIYTCGFIRGTIQLDKNTKYLIDKKDKSTRDTSDYFVKKLDISDSSLDGKIISLIDNIQSKEVRNVQNSEVDNSYRAVNGENYHSESIVQTQGDRSYFMKLELIVDTFYYELVAGRDPRFVIDAITNLVEILDRPFATERISVICMRLLVDDLYDTLIITPDVTPDYLVSELYYYRTFSLSGSSRYDLSYLLSGHPPIIDSRSGNSFTRVAYLNTICKDRGVGVMLNFLEDPYNEAAKMFFLIYTGFGGVDDVPTCRCDAPAGCIADPNLDPQSLRKVGNVGLSSCSYQDLRRYATTVSCLNIRVTFGNLPTKPTCGNWVQEEGEQCDCGREENCKGYEQDGICDFKTCKMKKKEYECLEGTCCTKDYKFVRKGVPCSDFTDPICDLYEGCTGDLARCPYDTWALDGTPCGSDRTKTCEAGICVSNHGTKRTFARKCVIKCNQHGVCNNRWNCHCQPGYICLFCVPFEGSEGGSIDSGAKCLSDPDTNRLLFNELVSAIIIILFLNVLPIVSTILYLIYGAITTTGQAASNYGVYSVADF